MTFPILTYLVLIGAHWTNYPVEGLTTHPAPISSTESQGVVMSEVWKVIPGYEGIYEVSDFGRVKSILRTDRFGRTRGGMFLSPGLGKNGYYTVALCKNGKQKSRNVHKLVMEAFVGKSEKVVNHIDGVRSNNNLSNLEYVTQRENVILGKLSQLNKSKSADYAGVSLVKSTGNFEVRKVIERKAYYLGVYNSQSDAHRVYESVTNEVEAIEFRRRHIKVRHA